MDELIQMVSQKAGLPEDQARTAVDTVLSFIKGRLPATVSAQIDSLVSSGGGGQAADLASKVGGMFSGKQ